MLVEGTWLCPKPADRVRFLDMERRMRPVRNAVLAVIGCGVLVLAQRWGWEVAALYAAVVATVPLIDRRVAAGERPEYWLMLMVLGGVAAIGGAVALTGGARSAALPWLVVPVVAATAVFTTRGVAVSLGAAILTAILSAGLVDTALLTDAPQYVVATVVLIISVGLYVNGLMRAEVHHRGESVLDPLTGLLNRTTLAPRFEELRQQAALTGAPISLIALDLDHFKKINDDHGHERGDMVLRDVAYELRKVLRSFELAYRLGGEEFLVILPGLDGTAAAVIADNVLDEVRALEPGGMKVTLSGGVSTGAGKELVYERLFEQADARLYEAKKAGRDRVIAPPPERDLQLVG